MKRIILAVLIGIFAVGLVFTQSAGSTMYVAVKSADLKASTGALANTVAVLSQGDRVAFLRDSGKWAEIRTEDSKTGWILMSSITSRRVTGSGYSATAGEIALAGKGFSPETEVEYRKNGLDFAAVDRMEAITVPLADLVKFIEDGRLAKGE